MAGDEGNQASGNTSYTIGNVGAHARVAQGTNISWVEGTFAATPEGIALKHQFTTLLQSIQQSEELDEVSKALALAKTEAVAEGFAEATENPGKLQLALVDAKNFLGAVAGWALDALSRILKSDAAQKTIGTITEASTKAAISSIAGAPLG
ncbi:MAG TPA: hypothetical protein VKV73_09240 [Chloroflexota bacterium]|nr:hypothetical protein [Chloroflexota bacterium]